MMPDIRNDLEHKSRRFELAPGALDRLFERQRRKKQDLRIRAVVLAAVIAAAGTWGAVSAFREVGGGRQPATSPTPSSDPRLYSMIAGVYTVTLTEDDAVVRANGIAGSYTMRLRPDGVLLLSLPSSSRLEGSSGVSFRLSGNQFITNTFVNLTCADVPVGVYEWELRSGSLTLTPLQESCDVRGALFGSKPWQRAT
jgi:hypothetical protein